jgi:hypothetical protein
MGGGLVGDDVGLDAAAHELRHHFVRIAEERDGDGLPLLGGSADDCERLVEVLGLYVDVAGAQAKLDAGWAALDGEQ